MEPSFVYFAILRASVAILILCGSVFADELLTPERFGLGDGNKITSQPFSIRVYKSADGKRVDAAQPQGFPFTIVDDYRLNNDEVIRLHDGVDLSSRPGPKLSPRPLDFKAGVYGVVVRSGRNESGIISVLVQNDILIEYLHTSNSYVQAGDNVTPDDLLGKTGMKGASVVHLHIRAYDSNRQLIHPETAIKAGQVRAKSGKRTLITRAKFAAARQPYDLPDIIDRVVMMKQFLVNRDSDRFKEIQILGPREPLPLPEPKLLEPKPLAEPLPLPEPDL